MNETNNYNFRHNVLSDMARAASSFLNEAAHLRQEIGAQAHLVDEYIEMLCESSIAMYPAEIAEDGFDAGRELYALCSDILDGKCEMGTHPFHAIATRYINEHPLTEGDRTTRIWIYLVALYGQYLEYAVNAYSAQIDAKTAGELGGRSCAAMRESILGMLDDERTGLFRGMEYSFNEFFSVMPSLALYLRGAAYQFVGALMHIDAETKRRVYQIIMDNPIPKFE